MQPSSDTPNAGRNRQLRRWGPIVAIVVVIGIVVAVVAIGGSDNGGDKGKTASGTDTTLAAGKTPDGAISWTQAKKDNADVTWPKTCDQKIGRIAIPDFYAPECFANHKGDNGGATAKGVTADTITVAVYVADPNDPIMNYITGAIKNQDTTEQIKETWQGYADLYNEYAQTYGRKVVLKFVTASGSAIDETSARADATKAADDLGAFAVWGGPALTNAWTDTLAGKKVICLGCVGGNQQWLEQRAPYVYTIGMGAGQSSTHLVEYLTKRVAGQKAAHAGDPALQQKDRRFGLLYIESTEENKKAADDLEANLKAKGIDLAARVAYQLDPGRLQEQASSAIAKMKSAGVTTVIFEGDPVAPASFTQEATKQNYRPEWLIGPSALVDTTAFARTYDQDQWSHAFGVSSLSARIDPTKTSAFHLYEWYRGTPPPAKDTAPVLWPDAALFFAGLQAAGPNLTPETFRQGIFSLPPRGGVTAPSVSWGDHGLWPGTDWNGIDDMTEIWWNPKATGPDEIRKDGTGMYEYVDGGKRFFPGKWTTGPTKAFETEGAVTIFDTPPAGESPPDYPSPAK